ncbi:DUF4145 domain-containing protein [Tranquillimonas rosea]|uniref:DUF4145 domain-containing protein n=1 Tax=Tranquillimonas rosea TaxID=641238 RepID=UPI003BAA02AB
MRMIELPTSSIRNSTKIPNGFHVPSVVNCSCPQCGRSAAFRLLKVDPTQNIPVASLGGNCPGCNERALFVAYFEDLDDERQGHASNLYLIDNENLFFPQPSFPEGFPVSLGRAISGAVDAYNASNLPAASTSGRRALEGIFKHIAEEDTGRKPLNKLIDAAIEKKDFSEPISRLSHAIREGGNFGAHFDLEREPSRLMVRHMLELLDYLVSYLFTLPQDIKALEDEIEREPNVFD